MTAEMYPSLCWHNSKWVSVSWQPRNGGRQSSHFTDENVKAQRG